MGAFLEAFGWWLWPTNVAGISLIVFLTVAAISYGFELFSKLTGKGRYDFIDAVASVIGGVIGMLAALILLFIFA